jgi:hypothetical protein
MFYWVDAELTRYRAPFLLRWSISLAENIMPGRCCSEDPEKRRGCITRRPNPPPIRCVKGRNKPGRTADRIAIRGPVLRAANKRSADITSRLFDKCPRLVAELPEGNDPDYVSLYKARRLRGESDSRVNIK